LTFVFPRVIASVLDNNAIRLQYY